MPARWALNLDVPVKLPGLQNALNALPVPEVPIQALGQVQAGITAAIALATAIDTAKPMLVTIQGVFDPDANPNTDTGNTVTVTVQVARKGG